MTNLVTFPRSGMEAFAISPQLAMEHMEEEKTSMGVYVIVIPTVFKRLEKRNSVLKAWKNRVKRVSRKPGADFSMSGDRV